MKIEGYLFVPYQGQFRFRYDDGTESINRIYKSDGAYDKVLNVPHYTRTTTCKELIHSEMAQDKWLPAIEAALKPVKKTLELSKRDTVLTVDMGPAPILMQNKAARVLGYFVLV